MYSTSLNDTQVAFPIESMVNKLDVKEECVSTLLCYLELEGWLEVMNPVNDSCTLKCYNGAKQLRALAQKVPAVAAATARLREDGGFIQIMLALIHCIPLSSLLYWYFK